MTVTRGDKPTTAPMTREKKPATAEEKKLLASIAETLKDETAESYHERGTLYVMAGEKTGTSAAYEAGLNDFSKCIELDPKLIGAYGNRAMAKVRLGRLEEALADYDTTIKLDPKAAYAYARKGSVLAKLGRDKEAVGNYDKAYELGDLDAAFNRGNAHLRMGNKKLAKRDYQLAVKGSKNPRVVEAAKMNLEAISD